ncbi:hypothetical protein CALCODRAFT_489391 [Calocera cornea HHB12733]|uniref:Uncharacterized protein n=1 Tax=Calocera cornea HHB12733 TaxID=1353952 RepID=A0A165K9W4_9BASI|nr:hypothetical protein CALCODRAFT_489391 [Calocera cornea HHB12733]
MADAMEEDAIPSAREMELLGQLREKEKQVNALVEDITALRAFVPTQPLPAPVVSGQALPPSLLALLTPLLRANPPSGVPSASIITSRVDLLQRENDELYELLKESNVAQLKEEVTLLRQTVVGLDTALRESHATITSVSSQLSQAQEALISLGNPPPSAVPASPITNTAQSTSNGSAMPQTAEVSPSSSNKPIPTGPRSQTIKRPPRTHPPPSQSPSASPIAGTANSAAGAATPSGLSVRGAASTPMTHELPRRPSPSPRRSRSRSPDRHSGDRSRDRYPERDLGRQRDRSPPRGGRRNDNGGDNGGGRRRPTNNNARRGGPSGGGGPVGPVETRSLVERMGL